MLIFLSFSQLEFRKSLLLNIEILSTHTDIQCYYRMSFFKGFSYSYTSMFLALRYFAYLRVWDRKVQTSCKVNR